MKFQNQHATENGLSQLKAVMIASHLRAQKVVSA